MVLKVAMAMRNGQQIEGRDEWLGQNERTLRGGPRRRLVSKRGPASATSRARPWNAPPALRGGPKRPLVLSIPCGAGPRGPMCLACQLEPRLSLRDEAFAIFFFFFPSLRHRSKCSNFQFSEQTNADRRFPHPHPPRTARRTMHGMPEPALSWCSLSTAEARGWPTMQPHAALAALPRRV